MAGLYIHIPFCKQRCRYCAFFSSTLADEKQRYIDALCKEIEMRKDYILEEQRAKSKEQSGKLETIYFGGGTPSQLSAGDLHKIFDTIYKHYNVLPDAEITLEANPDDLRPEYLEALRTLPINRISMGVQSFNDRQLRSLGRRHTAMQVHQAVTDARAAGFNNISIDLIFALPDSTPQEWAFDVESAIALKPNHISAYNLTYEEGTPLHKALLKGEVAALSEEENIAQFHTLIEKLSCAGYRHYEISNFAQPGCESRHNSSYWNDSIYLGCGAAAHSYNRASRCWNIADIKEYIRLIECGECAFEAEHLTREERYNDAVLTRLRTADGIPMQWVKEIFGEQLHRYMMHEAEKHIKYGNLKEVEGCLSLTTKGIFISDAVIRDLIYVD